MTYDKLIINLTPTGMVPTKSDTPYVPLTPEEIAADCYRCYRAGTERLSTNRTSMLQAVEQGKANEIEALGGLQMERLS